MFKNFFQNLQILIKDSATKETSNIKESTTAEGNLTMEECSWVLNVTDTLTTFKCQDHTCDPMTYEGIPICVFDKNSKWCKT